MFSKVAFVFKIIRLIIFSAVEKANFSQSRNFSLIAKFFHGQGSFPRFTSFPGSRKFSTVKEILHKNFLLDQGRFSQSRKFSTKKILQTRKFSTKTFIFDQGSFQKTMIFTHSKKVSANKNQKRSLKNKILDAFNTKSYAKIFFTL